MKGEGSGAPELLEMRLARNLLVEHAGEAEFHVSLLDDQENAKLAHCLRRLGCAVEEKRKGLRVVPPASPPANGTEG